MTRPVIRSHLGDRRSDGDHSYLSACNRRYDGIVPSPLTRGSAPRRISGKRPLQPSPSAAPESRLASNPLGTPSRDKRADAPPQAAQQSTAPSQTVPGSGSATAPVCNDCGTVTSVRTVKQQASRAPRPAAGGLVGGVIGHQIASGTGQYDCDDRRCCRRRCGSATEIERRANRRRTMSSTCAMDDGTVRHFTYASPPGVEAGSKVRLVDGKLVTPEARRCSIENRARPGFFRALDRSPSGYSLERWPTPRFCRAHPLRMKSAA